MMNQKEMDKIFIDTLESVVQMCEKNISFEMTEPKSRVQMLQEGWFIQPEPICISRPYAKYKTGNWRIAR